MRITRQIRYVCAILLMLLLLSFCSSCVQDGDGAQSTAGDTTSAFPEETTGTQASETVEDGSYVTAETYSVRISDLVIVRADGASAAVSALAVSLRDALTDANGVTPTLKNDWVKDESQIAPYELLLGETNRKESKEGMEGLTENEYRITVIGTKIVLAAGSERCLSAAAEAFTAALQSGFLLDTRVKIPLPYEEREEVPLPEVGLLQPEEREYAAMNYTDMKCLWISQFDLSSVYSSGGSQRAESAYRQYVNKILDNTVACGFNTVILQMRPNADSMYPSEYYPPSTYVVGAYGKDFTYDPVAIFIELAHARGLSLQAWINPLRGMTDDEIKKIDEKYPIRQWYDNSATRGTYIVNVDGRWYLNPAYVEVRELIQSGATEILMKYDVDGLHMDDYFYPTTAASFDSAAYSDYKKAGGKKTLADFRREQLNLLVKGLFDLTKAVDETALFGISPAGNWNNVYDSHYADVYTWCGVEGYIDYICPQVYFGMEHASYDFKKTCETWRAMIKTDKVRLVIGMTLGKAKSGTDNYAGSGKNEWTEHKDVLLRCLEYTATMDECVGVAYFCYQYFYNPTSGVEVAETKAERDNFIPRLKEITWIAD